MKLLPLLLLLSFACHGQVGHFAGDTTLKENQFIFGAQKGRYWSGTVWPEPSLELLQYAKECYNDSTKDKQLYHITSDSTTCQRLIGWGNSVSYGVCEKQSHYRTKYIHRKPTFEGFIEWLRKNKP